MESSLDKNSAIVSFRPIGHFSSNAHYPYEVPRQACYADQSLGCIDVLPENGFSHALEQIEGFSHIWLIYQFHVNQNWRPKVRPPRGSDEKVGVWATRSPHRPNPIGLSCVELVKRRGLTLWIRHYDLLNNTPILDIKPYIAAADSFPQATTGWLQSSELFILEYTPLAQSQLIWIEEKTCRKFQQFLKQQLEYQPFDRSRKRVQMLSSNFPLLARGLLAFRTWRCLFSQITEHTLQIEGFFSVYSLAELESQDDRYHDKAIHRHYWQDFGLSALWPEVSGLISNTQEQG